MIEKPGALVCNCMGCDSPTCGTLPDEDREAGNVCGREQSLAPVGEPGGVTVAEAEQIGWRLMPVVGWICPFCSEPHDIELDFSCVGQVNASGEYFGMHCRECHVFMPVCPASRFSGWEERLPEPSEVTEEEDEAIRAFYDRHDHAEMGRMLWPQYMQVVSTGEA